MTPTTTHFDPIPNRDFTPLVREALRDPACRRLVFRPGRYDFRPDFAEERYVFPSNNDEGLKRIAFPLFGRDGMEIAGEGAHFVFHGGILPVAAADCEGVRLRGFSIDWEIPFHGEAEVIAVGPAAVDLRICDGFAYRVSDGRLEFGEGPFEVKNILAFDAERRETAFLAHDNYGIGRRCLAVETGPRRVRLETALSEPLPSPGDILAIMGERRDYPGLFLSGCADAEIEDVTIRHAGGMGVIAQRCADLTLRRVTVAPPVDGSRMISTTADATHFVNCRGHVRLLDCVFENQMDDPANIHGIYAQVAEFSAPDTVLVRLRHPQQFGVPVAVKGDRVELVRGTTLVTLHETEVADVEILNKEYARIRLRQAPPEHPAPGDVLGNLTWNPAVEIRGCRCRGNRARGFLLSSSGRTVVEDNEFHTPGAAILVASDAHDWFESGHVRDVLIRRNRFVSCNYGVWGLAAIQILPRIDEPDPAAPRYHRNVRIEDNEFTVFDPRLVFARGIAGLRIAGNRILSSYAYLPHHGDAPPFDTGDCTGVVIADNLFEDARENAFAASA